MICQWRSAVAAAVAGTLACAGLARADVTGSSDGELTGKKVPQPISASAVFTQSGKTVSGTLAVGGDTFAGAYLVHGTATAKRMKVSGALGATFVKWTARITGDTLQGKARFKGSPGKLVGTLALTKNPPLADGTACDAIFTANQTVFVDQVLGDALRPCTTCHVPGGQAADARFRVDVNDPLATARIVAALVDSANPDTSRILEKPLNLVPHGGGQQIVPGSLQETELRSWVALVAAARCS